MITKTEYRRARRLIRDNGRFALKWLAPRTRAVMAHLCQMQDFDDWLAVRADIVGYCQREGRDCNVRHTRPTREYQGGRWIGAAQ